MSMGKCGRWIDMRLAFALGVLLFASASLPNMAFATMEEDQTPATQEEINEALQLGLLNSAEDLPDVYANSDYAVKTIGGANRYETSAKEALYRFPNSRNVIIASGAGYADSICAAGLAGALDCPILLTEPGDLSSVAADALRSMGAQNIILLGSENVASASVEASIRNLVGQSGTVERVCGPDRYSTQMAVYNYGVQHGLWSGDTAVVTSATGFADALSISPISFALKAPVFYCDESRSLPSAQRAAVQNSGKTKFLLTGSTAVTSENVESYLSGLGSVRRLGGSDRYATSRVINDYAVSNLGFTWNGVAVTSGSAPYDALGGGSVQGRVKSVLALMEEGDYHYEVSAPFGDKPTSMIFFGDRSIFSMAFKTKIARSLGFSLSDIEGFRVYIDAGHGGNDSGAVSGGYVEADLTRDLAYRVSDRLNSMGISTYVCDNGLGYKLRQHEAFMLDCGLFVSIHFNASGGSGTESYIHSYNSAAGSSRLQREIHKRLIAALGLVDRGMKREAFAVTGGRVPSTLLEIAFIDRPSDMKQYMSRRDQAASAIAEGVSVF